MTLKHKKDKQSLDECGYISILLDCDQKCLFCSVAKREEYVDVEKIKEKISNYIDRGITQIALTGGEPTIHPSLLEIIRWASKRIKDIRIITNGVKLENPSFVKALGDAGLSRIVISIHSFDEKISDDICGVKGAHKKRMKGLMNVLKDGRMEVNLNITIIKQNYAQLDSMAEQIIKLRKGNESLITHVNLNFVDAHEEAAKNKTCVPKFSAIELKLHKALEILEKGDVNVKIERTPLCYLRGFEHLSSDANRLSGAEHYYLKLPEKEREYSASGFAKNPNTCNACFLKEICPGVTSEYAAQHGLAELYPVFEDPVPIINKMYKLKSFKPTVHCSAIKNYDFKKVLQVMKKGFDQIGGLKRFIGPKSKVLIKPNLFIDYPPEKCATTHPVIIKAIIRLVKQITKDITVGDGSGMETLGKEENVLDVTGIRKVCREEGVACINFNKHEFVPIRFVDYEVLEATDLAKAALEADVIINVPKLKTHGIVFLTGAIKNFVGTMRPEERTYIHSEFQNPEVGGSAELFSRALVDVFSSFQNKPMLTVMDAIESMEGEEGPLKGNPVKTGFILLSTDAVAVDSVAARILGYNPLGIPTTRIADERLRGFGKEKNISIVGDSIKLDSFSKSSLFYTINRVKLIKGYGDEFTFKPFIDNINCCRCGSCVKMCPVEAICMKNGAISFDYDKCIGCFICKNVCPNEAIFKKKVMLDKKPLTRHKA